ncbi:hypothetical protein LEP1GSC073_4384 [Leptospira noguchii str. Cascata]|nr:hypothetical protein LEP1GSC072_1726 [Leptospira noguchii str. Bonito]EMS89534.1 hypothetical protein LEP1GSC073_4384 [Leptospira noguchii str. Cascata]
MIVFLNSTFWINSKKAFSISIFFMKSPFCGYPIKNLFYRNSFKTNRIKIGQA